MKPGERIRLIKGAAAILGDQSEAEVDLTLTQHGLQTRNADYYEGDMAAYAISILGDAPDSVLTDLSEFLEGESAGRDIAHVATGSGPWGDLPVRVFLSHVHHDKKLVGDIKRRLAESYGIDAFVAHDDIHPSKTWRDQIKAGLATCHYFAAVLHKNFHDSEWCDQEVGWALARGLPILPIRKTAADRKDAKDGFLEEHQDICLDATTGLPDYFAANHIFMGVVREPSLRPLAVKAMAEAFVTSKSFDFTRMLWGLLENQPSIESEQLRRLEYAVQTNRQVYEAVRIPDGTPIPALVKGLVEKFEPPVPETPWGDEPPF